MQRTLNNRLFAIVLPALIGLAGAVVSVRYFEQYGWSLFVCIPFVVSFLSSFAWSYGRTVPFSSSYGKACLSLTLLGGFILIFALDGLLCLVMALPLSFVLALSGTMVGNWLGSSFGPKAGATASILLCLTWPLVAGFEHSTARPPELRQVTTTVEINATPEMVWDAVVAFPKITDPPEGIFRMGIAYPIEARIEGSGVGAIRYCTFSTGSFVEPITEWNRPHKLAFDVSENPIPMQELSIYHDMKAPHLHGYMVSQRGQFRLIEKDGKTVLEGTTWYTHRIAPEFYWSIISDEIIHRIHIRVLSHIQRSAERKRP